MDRRNDAVNENRAKCKSIFYLTLKLIRWDMKTNTEYVTQCLMIHYCTNMSIMTSNLSTDPPDQVNFLVPRIDVKHRADASHVVLVVVSLFNVLVPDGHTAKQLKVFR